MKVPPEDQLAETRAALAPTLQATASILPWVAKPPVRRFDKALNQRWSKALRDLREDWAHRHLEGEHATRRSIFALYGLALESGDADCLLLGEALASAADHLENAPNAPRLLAALTATLESLDEAEGLEHPLFGERARHFAQRLQQSATEAIPDNRSDLIDHLFVSEAYERISHLREAMDALPLDVYALKVEAEGFEQHAEQLELWGLVHLLRELRRCIPAAGPSGDDSSVYRLLDDCLKRIQTAVAAIEG